MDLLLFAILLTVSKAYPYFNKCIETNYDHFVSDNRLCWRGDGIYYCCSDYHKVYNSSINKYICTRCLKGYHGRECDELCPSDSYGYRCLQTCNCKIGEICHHAEGCIGQDMTTPPMVTLKPQPPIVTTIDPAEINKTSIDCSHLINLAIVPTLRTNSIYSKQIIIHLGAVPNDSICLTYPLLTFSLTGWNRQFSGQMTPRGKIRLGTLQHVEKCNSTTDRKSFEINDSKYNFTNYILESTPVADRFDKSDSSSRGEGKWITMTVLMLARSLLFGNCLV
ncbi:Hypothetical predicted protein [Mytilus galloprovincialis]|uniref:EGF-like domain-containing protein n=1 Tax=Mytilus galloprovincialis TaxID=29158 RepID=A0A8B6E1S2_MYTGA|nr:Hypothetical predicted protein [Mytilus galloprovincialis]